MMINRYLTPIELATVPPTKIRAAIAECDAYIAREERRDSALRPVSVAQLLTKYRAHRADLQNLLSVAR